MANYVDEALLRKLRMELPAIADDLAVAAREQAAKLGIALDAIQEHRQPGPGKDSFVKNTSERIALLLEFADAVGE